VTTIDRTPIWESLVAHQRAMAGKRLRELFAADPGRVQRLTLTAGDIHLDYSKNLVTDETMRLLHDLARAADLGAWISRLFGGQEVNPSEGRPALHTALRRRGGTLMVDGVDVMADILAVREQMRRFSAAVRGGEWRGATGERITDVVNIGIGGSDLGPRMVVEALGTSVPGPLRLHFVSGLDDAQFAAATAGLDPARTLFILASKSFTTLETSANGDLARKWLKATLKDDAAVNRHLVSVTSNLAAARKAGFADEQIFPIWNWVGGRYSVWSAIGLPVALAHGMDTFDRLLAGARAMDDHFRDTPIEENIPATLALLGIWYLNFCNAETQVVLPYDWRLRLLPSWLQQLDMESNGKSVDRVGRPVAYRTAPIIWGGSGNDGQHAFYQLLHQGTHLVPADFIVASAGSEPAGSPLRDLLVSNFLAQTEALMKGRDETDTRAELKTVSGAALEDLIPHKLVPGNRPTNSIMVRRLDAASLVALLAMYEHKVFVQGVVWGINSFDQFGVELGKTLADRITPELKGERPPEDHDSSTTALIELYKEWRKG
jgi:glucose-6-phosphate isomerase